MWDTAGQERYHALNQIYYRGAEGKLSFFNFLTGAIIVFDCSEAQTFDRVSLWTKEVTQYI